MKKFNSLTDQNRDKLKSFNNNDTVVQILEKKFFKKTLQVHPTLDNDQKVESVVQEQTSHNEQLDDMTREDLELKCKFAAIVMDRFFFCIALAYSIITFSTLVLSIPNLYS